MNNRQPKPLTELATACEAALRVALPAGAVVTVRPTKATPEVPGVDGWVRILGPWGEMEIPFLESRTVHAAVVALMDRRLGEQGRDRPGIVPRWILFTEYVNPREARRLREGGIAFADARGNVHLYGTAIHVWVVGNRPPARRSKAPRLFRPAAARVLFTLLQDPRRAGESYRALAARAGVAPDTVNRVFNDLRDKGFLQVLGGRERAIIRAPELLELWTLAYGDALRPKLHPTCCRWARRRPVEDLLDVLPADPRLSSLLLGGELGAAALTNLIRPTTATLHVPPGEQRAVMKALGLFPHPEGALTLAHTFGTTNAWTHSEGVAVRLADPLLIHAELLQVDDDRARVVAADLYDRYVIRRFPNDR